jgi:hypothetical protein
MICGCYISFVERVSQLNQVSCPDRLISLFLSDGSRTVVVVLDSNDSDGTGKDSEILVCYAGKSFRDDLGKETSLKRTHRMVKLV